TTRYANGSTSQMNNYAPPSTTSRRTATRLKLNIAMCCTRLMSGDARRRRACANTWRKHPPRLRRLRKLRCMRSWPSNEEKLYESCSTKRLLSHREYHTRDYAAGRPQHHGVSQATCRYTPVTGV